MNPSKQNFSTPKKKPKLKPVGMEIDAFEVLEFMSDNYRISKTKIVSKVILRLSKANWKDIMEELSQENKDKRLKKIEDSLRARQIRKTRVMSRTIVTERGVHHRQVEETTIDIENDDQD